MSEMDEKENMRGLDKETFGELNSNKQEPDMGGIANDEKVSDASSVEETKIYTPEWKTDAYAQADYNTANQPVEKKEGKALEVCSLVFGILSIITCCCCGGLFGVIGLVLSIIALVKGKKSGLSMAGLICSIIGLLLSLSIVLYSFSEEGQKAKEEFEQGFKEGYESTYNELEDNKEQQEYVQSDADMDEEISSDEEKEGFFEEITGTEVLSSDEVGKIEFTGKTFALPCKLSDVMDGYEVDEFFKEELEGTMESSEYRTIFLVKDGESIGVSVTFYNETSGKLDNVMDATVTGIQIDNMFLKDSDKVKICRGIEMNESRASVEKKLKGLTYSREESEGCVFYNFIAGENQEYTYVIMLQDDSVVSVSVSYFKMPE